MKSQGALEGNVIVEILIAVVCLAIVATVAIRYYSSSTQGDAEAAKAFLASVSAKADSLEVDETNSFIFRGVEGWYFKGWSKGEAGRPDKCAFASCICICRDPSAETCQSRNGYCQTLNFDIVKVTTDPFTVKGTYTKDPKDPTSKSGAYETTYYPNCVPLLSNFMSFNVSKTDNSLIITYLWRDSNDMRSEDSFRVCSTKTTKDL